MQQGETSKTTDDPSQPSTYSSSPEKKITLRSSDGKEFKVDETVAKMSQTFRHMFDSNCAVSMPVKEVTGKVLKKVIEYCTKHVWAVDKYGVSADEALIDWDDKFLNANLDILFDLLFAADYMFIQGLFDLTCKKVAGMMAGESPEEIRKMFNIENDYTPEEEEEVRRQNRSSLVDA